LADKVFKPGEVLAVELVRTLREAQCALEGLRRLCEAVCPQPGESRPHMLVGRRHKRSGFDVFPLWHVSVIP
jgi:hypothetical protein